MDFEVPDMPKVLNRWQIPTLNLNIRLMKQYRDSMLLIFGYITNYEFSALIIDYEQNSICSQYSWKDDNGKILDVAESSELTGPYLTKYGVGRGSSFEIF